MNPNAFSIVNMVTVKNKEPLPEPIKEDIHEYRPEKDGKYDCIICCDEYDKENIKFPCKISKNHTLCDRCFEESKNN
jgi:hypothetical protein